MKRDKSEIEFKPGEECFYVEDGGVIRCEVVSANHNSGWLRFQLKVVEVIRPDHFGTPNPEIGKVIRVEKDSSFKGPTSLIWELLAFNPVPD